MKSVLVRNLGFLGYPNYEVDSEGNVWSLDYNHTGEKRVMKGGKDKNGYPLVLFHKDGKRKTWLVHRLVALAFIPNPDNLPQVNHKDEDKENNNVSNLEWCTCRYNNNYGTRNQRVGDGQPKKAVQQFSLDGTLINTYQSTREAQRATGIFQTHICKCCKHKPKHKTAGGFIWRYKEEN